jgi:acetoin utilization deacetylase AcuC-like enzyme
MATGIVKDKRYMDHHMEHFHVETPQRLEVIYRMIDEKISFSLDKIEPIHLPMSTWSNRRPEKNTFSSTPTHPPPPNLGK